MHDVHTPLLFQGYELDDIEKGEAEEIEKASEEEKDPYDAIEEFIPEGTPWKGRHLFLYIVCKITCYLNKDLYCLS